MESFHVDEDEPGSAAARRATRLAMEAARVEAATATSTAADAADAFAADSTDPGDDDEDEDDDEDDDDAEYEDDYGGAYYEYEFNYGDGDYGSSGEAEAPASAPASGDGDSASGDSASISDARSERLRRASMLEERLKALVTPDKVATYDNVPRNARVTHPAASVGVGLMTGDIDRVRATVWKLGRTSTSPSETCSRARQDVLAEIEAARARSTNAATAAAAAADGRSARVVGDGERGGGHRHAS